VGRQTRLRRHQRDCSQDRRQYVRRSLLPLCSAIPRGAYAPRSCVWARTSAGERRFFRCTNAQPTKSGGRQPAVGSIVPRGQCTASNVRRVTTVQSRAAGVSPPWFGFALATAIGFCGLITFRPAQSLRIPRLAHASRSWCTRASRRKWAVVLCNGVSFPTGGLRPPLLCCDANVCRRKTIFAMHKRASERERRASARRGFHCAARTMHSE
jgi:hypothetical protein